VQELCTCEIIGMILLVSVDTITDFKRKLWR